MNIKQLPATAMNSHGADYVRAYHHVVVSPDVTLDDLLRPGFWAFHVKNLNKFDLIDVVAQDGSLDVQLRVMSKGVGFVEMRLLRSFVSDQPKEQAPVAEPEAELPEIPDGYKVTFAPKSGWLARTINPSETVSKDHKTKRAAILAAQDHARKAAGVMA